MSVKIKSMQAELNVGLYLITRSEVDSSFKTMPPISKYTGDDQYNECVDNRDDGQNVESDDLKNKKTKDFLEYIIEGMSR